jgi:hypothetical protein
VGTLPFTEEALLTPSRIPHAGYMNVLRFEVALEDEDDDEYEDDLCAKYQMSGSSSLPGFMKTYAPVSFCAYSGP